VHRANGVDSAAPRTRSLLPWQRRAQSVEQLREGQQRVLEMMDAMRTHFDSQDNRSEQMTHSVEHIAGTLERLAETQARQREFIAAIATHIETAGRQTRAISEALREVPATLQAQADAAARIAEQVEATRGVETRVVDSLDNVGRSVETLRDSSTRQAQSLEDLHRINHEHQQSVAVLLREQSRRFLIALIVVVALAALTATVLSVAVTRALAS